MSGAAGQACLERAATGILHPAMATRIYQDLGDGFVLSSHRLDPRDREILVGWRSRAGRDAPVRSGVTMTMETPNGQRYRIRVPRAGVALVSCLARHDTHALVVPGAGVVTARPGTNVGDVVHGPMKGVAVIF